VKTTTNAYTYDDQGNIKTETKSRSGVQGSYVITHSYDELNRLIKTVRPEGEDGNSQGNGGNITINYTYDSLGNLIKEQVGSKTTEYWHNELNQIYKKVAPESEDGNNQGNTLATYNYSYDNRGNLIEVTKGTNKVVESYVYDATNRMVEGSRAGGGDSSYIFDGFGHLVGNTAAVLMSEDEDGNDQGGGGQGGNGQGDEDEDEEEDGDGNGNDGNKAWFVNISKDYVIDYTSPLAHVILETESDSFDLVYQHVIRY